MEATVSTNNLVTYRDVFHNGTWIRLWAGQTVSQLGDAVADIAFPLLVYDLTRSAASLGLSLAIELLPLVVVGPVAGVFADRWNRRTLLLLTDAVRIACALGLFASTSVWQIYLLALLASIMQATFLPAYSAVIPQITEGQYAKSISLSYMGFQTMQVAGPMVAAMVVGLAAGPRPAFLFDAVTFAVGCLLTMTIRVGDVPRREPAQSVLGGMRVGASLLWRNAVARCVAAWNAVIDIAGAAATLGTIVYIKEMLRLPGPAGDQLYGLTGATLAGSFAVVTWLLGLTDGRVPKRLLMLWGPLPAGLAYLAFGLHPGAGAILPLFVVVSIGTACSIMPAFAYLAAAVPSNRRGRVYALTNATGALAKLASYGVCGVLAVHLPPEGLLLISGGVLLTGMPFCMYMLQGARVLQEHDAAHLQG
jgi:MFS family permease